MDRAKLKRSKLTASTEGSWRTQNQKTASKLAGGSSLHSVGGTSMEDLLTPGLVRKVSKRVIGPPIKKLLAEEMLKEAEAKRQSPSVITRLMGLEGLPPQQSVNRQKMSPSENHPQRTTMKGCQRTEKPYDRHLNRKGSMEKQEFKDVYEVIETSKVESSGYSSKGIAESKLSEAEIAFIQQKFLEVKCLSSHEKLRGSTVFSDATEMQDSKKDILVKYFRQPDSLFAKHIHDLHDAAPRAYCSHVPVIQQSDYEKYESSAIGWKLERESLSKFSISSHQRHQDGHSSHSYRSPGSHNSLKLSEVEVEVEPLSGILPARIVLLKPNIGKTQIVNTSVPSPCSHACPSDVGNHGEYLTFGAGEVESCIKKNLYNDVGFSRPKSKESRVIAKEITRKMRESFIIEGINLSSTVRGYAGDESSYTGSDSASESDVMILTSRNSFDWSDRQKLSSSRLVDSSVNREARKRLSERWRMTHRYQDVGVSCRGSTLAEMLSITDRKMRPENLDAMAGLDGHSDGFSRIDGSAGLDVPLGISSRDGWKEGCTKNLSRQSLPAYLVGNGGLKAQHGPVEDDRYLMPKEATNRGRNRTLKGNLNQKEDFWFRNRSSCEKLQSSRCTHTDGHDSLQEIHPNLFQTEIYLGKDDPFEQKLMVTEMPANTVADASSITDAIKDTEHVNAAVSSESPDDLLTGPSTTSMLETADCSACDLEDSKAKKPLITSSEEGPCRVQCPILEPQSPSSLKEVDHLSPASVLEVTYTEDVSCGSECFERVSADLHELRMQLKLLKMESEAYEDGPSLRSTNDDVRQGIATASEERGAFKSDCWESSYLSDVLIDSGFNDTNTDVLMATWHSPECPLGPWVFDNLEKKYGDEADFLKSDRKLLFDRINSALFEIFQYFKDPQPWVKPLRTIVGSKWEKDRIKSELCKLLARKEKSADEDVADNVFESKGKWLDLGDDINAIGKEIEMLLLDDLVASVLTV